MKSRSSNSNWSLNSTWQEAATNRLESSKTKQNSKEIKTKTSQKIVSEPRDFVDDGPSLSELEAELDNLMKKIETENNSIEEVKAVRAQSRDYRSVIAHAKRDKQADHGESVSFFITSVDAGGNGDNEVNENRCSKPFERYPNYNKEVVLAKEAGAEQKKMSRLELQASKLQNETRNMISKPGTKTKSKYSEGKIQKTQRKENRKSSMEQLLPSINVKK